MTDMDFNKAVARLRELEKQIQGAQVEVRLRENRLAELRPKREALEAQCQEEFQCAIKELPSRIEQAEINFTSEVEKLEAELNRISVA